MQGIIALAGGALRLEVARLVLFLLSDDSAYVTGAEMAIDGGVSL